MQFYGGIAGPWKRHEPVSVRTAVIDWHSARQTEKGIKKQAFGQIIPPISTIIFLGCHR